MEKKGVATSLLHHVSNSIFFKRQKLFMQIGRFSGVDENKIIYVMSKLPRIKVLKVLMLLGIKSADRLKGKRHRVYKEA